jgi:hypothetical protein
MELRMSRQLLLFSLSSLIAVSTVTAAAVQPTPMQAAPVASSDAKAKIDTATERRVIEAAIAKMAQDYVFPDKVPAIAKVLRAGVAGEYRTISDPKAFADAVNADIERVANDRHMRLFWSPEPLPPLPDPEHLDPAMVKQQAEFMARRNYAIRQAQVLDGNVGYLKINGFLPPEEAGPTMAAAMEFLKNSDALIVDLRDNGGGDPNGVAMLVSYIEPPQILINTFHRRDKPVNDQIWTMPYVPGGRWSTDKPVYVLTSKDTASGAEEFAYDMQQLKRGTVVGAPTWGGANPGKIEPIDDHFAIFIPFGSAVNPISKTNWEGRGVKPDVAVDPAVALETARRMAITKLLETAKGDRARELQQALHGQPTH